MLIYSVPMNDFFITINSYCDINLKEESIGHVIVSIIYPLERIPGKDYC